MRLPWTRAPLGRASELLREAAESLGWEVEALERGAIAGAGLDVFSQEPLAKSGHPMSRLYEMDNVILSPHLTFYTPEAMRRLEVETLERCFEILEGREVVVKSEDPRLR